jgi:hypothetical protein
MCESRIFWHRVIDAAAEESHIVTAATQFFHDWQLDI